MGDDRASADASGGANAPQVWATKEDILLEHHLRLMNLAYKYDLENLKDRALSNRDLSRLFFDLCYHAEIDLFIEAGAMDASTSRRAREWFPEVRVVAFEASPTTFEQFKERNAEIEYLNLALTDTPGPVEFLVRAGSSGEHLVDGKASLLPRHKDVQAADEAAVAVAVEGVTLDGFFAGRTGSRVGLWVDVEGACKLVLQGARELLTRTAVLMIEVEEEQFWGENHWLRPQVVSFLFDLGLVPVARDFEYVQQYNLVFVRRDLLNASNRMHVKLARFLRPLR